MCGFFISNDDEINSDHEAVIESSLRFRGPDGSSGLLFKNGWASYHSRLSIIDLTEGTNQPVINKDGSQLVFNGEILNYKELGKKYFGVEYKSDTFLLNDLILNDLINLHELDGFFAFVFIDSNGCLKYACRDKFGVKPLFYYESTQGITLSSEPNALIELYSPEINQAAIDEYRAFRAPIFQGSFYAGIKQVEPGSCLINGQYFDVEDELCRASQRAVSSGEVADALRDGVISRCIADAPVGLLLSKGVDSNLIRHTGNFERMYSIGFPGDEDLEFLMAKNIDRLECLKVSADTFRAAFRELVALRKEPLSVPNEVLLFLIAKRARGDGIKVLLSGEGADEFFGGYDRIFAWASTATQFSVDKFLELYAYGNVPTDSKNYIAIDNLFANCALTSPFEMVRWFFIRYHMPVLFRRLDFALMAAGVEGREPIANHHLFNVCKNMSAGDLMGDNVGKLPLRQLLETHMGREFAYSQKIGFPVDLTEVFPNPSGASSYELWFSKNLEVLR